MNKELNEKTLLKEKTITSVEFDGEWYFKVSDVSTYLEEDLSDVETVSLPLKGGAIECATIDFLKAGRKKTERTEFDKKIIQALNYKPQRKK
ncbi:MAG: hypothetical protein ABIQ27_03280 [Flavobacterium sp.]|uniref:hypothetical protein n=1 Tax=Flavobacterium sp. TaxID=239 RepID=UPI003263DAB6